MAGGEDESRTSARAVVPMRMPGMSIARMSPTAGGRAEAGAGDVGSDGSGARRFVGDEGKEAKPDAEGKDGDIGDVGVMSEGEGESSESESSSSSSVRCVRSAYASGARKTGTRSANWG